MKEKIVKMTKKDLIRAYYSIFSVDMRIPKDYPKIMTMEEFIKDSLPKDLEGYFLRCNISKHKNIYFPRLYDASGNKL